MRREALPNIILFSKVSAPLIVLYHTIPNFTILYYTILYYTILYYTILSAAKHSPKSAPHLSFHTKLDMLSYTILYITRYAILYYIIYYTIPNTAKHSPKSVARVTVVARAYHSDTLLHTCTLAAANYYTHSTCLSLEHFTTHMHSSSS